MRSGSFGVKRPVLCITAVTVVAALVAAERVPVSTKQAAAARGALDPSALYLVGSDGRARRLVARGAGPFGIAPNRTDLVYLASVRPGSSSYALWVTSLRGGRPRRLTGSLGTSSGGFDWSPSGDRIVYSGADMSRDAVPSSNGIFVVHPRRRTSRRIARNGIFPVWSHDGRRIAYVEPGAGSSPQHPHGTPNHVVVVTPAGRPLWRRTGSLAAWSPRGSRIAFVVGLDSAGVASARVVVASGGGAHVWTLEACRAEWSPDGSALALEATGPNCAGPNAIAQLGSRRIAVLPRSGGAVSWSADGRRIAWATGFPERGSILIGSAAGRISRTLPLWGSSLHWSPDGSHLLFGRPDGLWVVATDGSSRRRVARTYPYPTAHWVDARTIVYWTGPP